MSSSRQQQAQAQTQGEGLQQLQRVMMSPQMQQAIHLLQMPVMELMASIEQELRVNPVLECEHEQELPLAEGNGDEESFDEELSFADDDLTILKQLDEDFRDHFNQIESQTAPPTEEDKKRKLFLDQSIQERQTLNDHLMELARQSFDDERQQEMAEVIIGHIDQRGYLTTALEEIAQFHRFSREELEEVLEEIQSFEPYGVGARSMQETFLIQMRLLGKENSIAYSIVDQCFEDLLHNRVPQIAKFLGISKQKVEEAIHGDIAKLDLHPGTQFSQEEVQQIMPDITLVREGDGWKVVVEDECTPSLHLNRRYLKLMEDPRASSKTKNYVKQKVVSAKWLLRNLTQRHDTLERIAQFLTEKQKRFFDSAEGQLIPLKMKEVAEALEVHESTIARAVANKYLACDRGLMPLRSFFTNAYINLEGEELSSQTVRETLQRLIDNEDKLRPLSDQKLANCLQEQGIPCARRTIAKYRSELGLGNAKQRRRY